MSTLITNATIKNRRDTAGNWTTNDPVLGAGEIGYETDTGNLKIGDGSTAWTSLDYYVPASLPSDNDLTSADVTYTLPAITGAPQKKTIRAKNGGTYKLTMAANGTDTIDNLTPSTWTIEGEGLIVVESDGISDWVVVEFDDSGSNSDGDWKKFADGSLTTLTTGSSGTVTFTAGDGMYYFSVTFNLAYTNVLSPDAILTNKDGAISSRGSWLIYYGTTTATIQIYWGALTNTNTTSADITIKTIGRWRT